MVRPLVYIFRTLVLLGRTFVVNTGVYYETYCHAYFLLLPTTSVASAARWRSWHNGAKV